MPWTVEAPATDTTPLTTWLALARNMAACLRRHGMKQTQRWMSWPTETEQILKICTANLQTHSNKMPGMQRPREGHGLGYSIFQGRNGPKPALQAAPEPVRPKPRPRPEGAGALARRAKRPKPAPKVAPPPPEPKRTPQTCPYFTPDERKAMHPEYPDGAEVQGVHVCLLKGQPKQWVWFQGTVKHRMATPGKHGDLQLKVAWRPLLKWGKKETTSNFLLWDDRPFLECPLQLRTPENRVAPATVWTGDIPQAWLGE